MFENESQSYYEILDVKSDSSQNEIRQAYFRAKAAYGKDSAALYSLFDEQDTRQVLDNIEQAYLVLSNPEKRKEYDKIHGFLKSDSLIPTAKKTAANQNLYSFAKGAPSSSHEHLDPARAAARNMFGSTAVENIESGHGTEESIVAASGSGTTTGSRPREESHEDYATPRTLASSSAAGPPVQDYVSATSFNSRENRLGIVRRIDLVKTYERRPELEEEIAREAVYRGEFFRKVREYRGISVEELSDFTKISKTYINCIESEEFESLPAPAYLRGFVSQIAKALKLPHDKAAVAYMTNYKNTVLK